MVKSCYVKKSEATRKTLQDKHKQNLEFEKDLKLGIFGKNVLDKKKIVRIAHTPVAYNREFPNKYKMDPYI